MQIFDSYIEAGRTMNRHDREQYYTALIEYLFYGVEPHVTGVALAVITAIRPSLEESRARVLNGRKGGRPRKNQNHENAETQTPENEKANALDSKNQNHENAETQTPESRKTKSKSKGNEKELPSGSSKKRPHFRPPTVVEVSAYADEQGGRSFDAARFVDYYAAQGWKLSNGNPMKDWRAAVRNWVRKDEPGNSGRYAEYDV